MLLDSNIVIYAVQPQHAKLRQFIRDRALFVSAISLIEVLGYHKLLDADRADLEAFFRGSTTIPISENIIQQAVCLRQKHRMTLGDSIIAATGLTHQLVLVTGNIKDFNSVEGLKIYNPLIELPLT